MSLDFTGLQQQSSSPTSTIPAVFPQVSNENVTQANKDVLLERLNRLVLRLSNDSSLESSTISAICIGVDRLEGLLENGQKRTHNIPQSLESEKTDNILLVPPTPTQRARIRFPRSPILPCQPGSKEAIMDIQRATEIAESAQELTSKLTTTLAELQVRKTESDHIHDLLIIRVELAADRILGLEKRVKEAEEDFDTNQSELKFLRIQLQAIQAQCSQYIPRDLDQELEQSILNWKVAWQGIDERSKARRKKCHSSMDSSDSHGIVEEP